MARISQRYRCVSHLKLPIVRFNLLAFTGNVDLEILNPEKLFKVLESLDEILRNLFLRVCCWRTYGESSSYGLLDPTQIVRDAIFKQ